MPRNFSKYQYETSPRKLEPEYTPVKNPYKGKKKTVKKTTSAPNNKKNKEKELKKQKRKVIKYMTIGFLVLFGLCYRNSQIDENFAKMQSLKNELAEVEKQNTQLNISIQNSMNLSNIEQQAKELLGMQKLNSKQTEYVTLPKTDYIEPASESVIIKKDKNILETILSLFK